MVNRLLQAGTLTLATLALRSALPLGVGCVATASQLRQKKFFLLFFFCRPAEPALLLFLFCLAAFFFYFTRVGSYPVRRRTGPYGTVKKTKKNRQA